MQEEEKQAKDCLVVLYYIKKLHVPRSVFLGFDDTVNTDTCEKLKREFSTLCSTCRNSQE